VSSIDEFSSLQTVIKALQPLDVEARSRIIAAVTTFLQVPSTVSIAAKAVLPTEPEGSSQTRSSNYPAFSADTDMTPKEFLYQKQARSDVERIAVLGYYLTHFRETPHFKTLDLSKLNTEAAQPKFANAANTANNAVKQGYLVPSTKGMRQLSAAGERFVEALPDREAAKATMTAVKPRRRPAKKATPVSATSSVPSDGS